MAGPDPAIHSERPPKAGEMIQWIISSDECPEHERGAGQSKKHRLAFPGLISYILVESPADEAVANPVRSGTKQP